MGDNEETSAEEIDESQEDSSNVEDAGNAETTVVIDNSEDDGGSDTEIALLVGEHGARLDGHDERLNYVEGMIALAIAEAEQANETAATATNIAIDASIEASEASETVDEASEESEEHSEDDSEIVPDNRDHWFFRPIGRRRNKV